MKNTREFLERLVNDENFAKEFDKIKDFETLKEKAKKEGYDISKEEYNKLELEVEKHLSDEQLESASGGSAKQFFKDFGEGFVKGFTGTLNVVGNVVGLLTGK